MKFKLPKSYQTRLYSRTDTEVDIESKSIINRILESIMDYNIKNSKEIFKSQSYIDIKNKILACYESKMGIEVIEDDNGKIKFIAKYMTVKLKDEYKDGYIDIPLCDDYYASYVCECPKCGTPYLVDDFTLRDTIYCNICDENINYKRRIITPGKYRHFKGNNYEVLAIAKNANNNASGKPLVIYKALYGDGEVFYMDLREFSSKVNKIKYPNVEQEYRFERIDDNE